MGGPVERESRAATRKANEGFVKVVSVNAKVKAGGVLAKLENRCEQKDREIAVLEERVAELQIQNAEKDEELCTVKGLLEEANADLTQERSKTKALEEQLAVLRVFQNEKKISQKEIERITEQVRSSGFKTSPSPKSSDVLWASHSIEVEIEELISRLAKTEARLALTEEKCTTLEESNRELEQQRNQHQRHTQIVLKDKAKLAAELQALRDANSQKEADDYWSRSPLASKNVNLR